MNKRDPIIAPPPPNMNNIHPIYTRRLENQDHSQEISKLKMRLR